VPTAFQDPYKSGVWHRLCIILLKFVLPEDDFFVCQRLALSLRTMKGSAIRRRLFPKKVSKFQMPTYEYECAKCRKTFDHFQSMKDDALTVCPKEKCHMKKWGKGKVKRLLGGGAGLIFKGSGFYITDYRSEGYKSAAKSDSTDSGSKKSETKTESKPAKKTPAKSE
jgi:putative FmdB family regulatory protein